MRFVKPEKTILTLATGDRLIVRTELSCGEERHALARIYPISPTDGQRRTDPLMIGLGLVLKYLLDWIAVDEDGQPVPSLQGLPENEVIDILNGLDSASFAAIRTAIEAHELAMIAAREEKKTIPSTANGSEATSISVN